MERTFRDVRVAIERYYSDENDLLSVDIIGKNGVEIGTQSRSWNDHVFYSNNGTIAEFDGRIEFDVSDWYLNIRIYQKSSYAQIGQINIPINDVVSITLSP